MADTQSKPDGQDGDKDPTRRPSRYVDFERRLDDLRNDDVILEAQTAQTRRRILAEIRKNRLRGEKRQVDPKHYRL